MPHASQRLPRRGGRPGAAVRSGLAALALSAHANEDSGAMVGDADDLLRRLKQWTALSAI
jgi:hypothetical protein